MDQSTGVTRALRYPPKSPHVVRRKTSTGGSLPSPAIGGLSSSEVPHSVYNGNNNNHYNNNNNNNNNGSNGSSPMSSPDRIAGRKAILPPVDVTGNSTGVGSMHTSTHANTHARRSSLGNSSNGNTHCISPLGAISRSPPQPRKSTSSRNGRGSPESEASAPSQMSTSGLCRLSSTLDGQNAKRDNLFGSAESVKSGTSCGSASSAGSRSQLKKSFAIIDKHLRSVGQLSGFKELNAMLANPTKEDLKVFKSRFEGMFAILDSTVRMSSYPIVVMTTDCRVVLASPSIVNVLGYTSEELFGQNINMIMPHEIAQMHDAIIQRYVESVASGEDRGKVSSVVDNTRPVTCKAKDGSEVPVELTVKAVMTDEHADDDSDPGDVTPTDVEEESQDIVGDEASSAGNDFPTSVSTDKIAERLNSNVGQGRRVRMRASRTTIDEDIDDGDAEQIGCLENSNSNSNSNNNKTGADSDVKITRRASSVLSQSHHRGASKLSGSPDPTTGDMTIRPPPIVGGSTSKKVPQDMLPSAAAGDKKEVGSRAVVLFVAQLKDVRAEVNLRNTVEESKTLQMMFPFPYIEAGEDMIMTKFNPAAEEAFGMSAERAVGKNVIILMPDKIASARGSTTGRLRNVPRDSHDSLARNFISKVRSVGANNVTSRIIGKKVLLTAVRINNNDTRSLLPEPFPIELEVKMQLSSSGVIKFQAFIRDCENFLNAKEAEDAILKQTFPEPVANSLIAGESVNGEMNLAVIFVDLVKFTALSRLISDEVAMQVLDDVFSRFTALREKRCKFMDPIKINYDEFMCVCGLNPDYASQNIADQAVRVAEAMHEAVKEYNATSDWDVDIRVGIDVGPCQVGIIGSSGLKTFDLIGQTTVRASRAEGTCDAGGIHVMDTAYNALSDTYKHKFIEVKTEFKNMGSVITFKSIKNMSSAR